MDNWTTGMDHRTVYWNGLMEHWSGLLEHACQKFEVSYTIVCMHACTAKMDFSNGLVAGVASLSFYATQYL